MNDQQQTVGSGFCCCAPDAQSVFVAGTFNDWRPDATPLEKQENGFWRATLQLPPGHYEYRFIVDGEWRTESGLVDDDATAICCANSFGSTNRVREVKAADT